MNLMMYYMKAKAVAEIILKELLNLMILQRNEHKQFRKLIGRLPSFEQRNVLYSLIKIISRDYLSSSIPTEDNTQWWLSDATNISAAACLIKLVLDGEESRKSHLISWLTNSSGAGVGDGIAIRRAVIACITPDKAGIETVLEKSMQQFGDQLYIRHTPTLQQEGMCSFTIWKNPCADHSE
jgi:telomere length regulation protein